MSPLEILWQKMTFFGLWKNRKIAACGELLISSAFLGHNSFAG